MSPLDTLITLFIAVIALFYCCKQGYFDVFVAFGFIYLSIFFYWVLNPVDDEGGN